MSTSEAPAWRGQPRGQPRGGCGGRCWRRTAQVLQDGGFAAGGRQAAAHAVDVGDELRTLLSHGGLLQRAHGAGAPAGCRLWTGPCGDVAARCVGRLPPALSDDGTAHTAPFCSNGFHHERSAAGGSRCAGGALHPQPHPGGLHRRRAPRRRRPPRCRDDAQRRHGRHHREHEDADGERGRRSSALKGLGGRAHALGSAGRVSCPPVRPRPPARRGLGGSRGARSRVVSASGSVRRRRRRSPPGSRRAALPPTLSAARAGGF